MHKYKDLPLPQIARVISSKRECLIHPLLFYKLNDDCAQGIKNTNDNTLKSIYPI